MKEEEKKRIENLETEVFNLRRVVRYLARNHQGYITKRGQNGAPDVTQEYVDTFWLNKVDEMLGELKSTPQ